MSSNSYIFKKISKGTRSHTNSIWEQDIEKRFPLPSVDKHRQAWLCLHSEAFQYAEDIDQVLLFSRLVVGGCNSLAWLCGGRSRMVTYCRHRNTPRAIRATLGSAAWNGS